MSKKNQAAKKQRLMATAFTLIAELAEGDFFSEESAIDVLNILKKYIIDNKISRDEFNAFIIDQFEIEIAWSSEESELISEAFDDLEDV